MNNTFLYCKNSRFDEFKPDEYQDVVREFKRLLKPERMNFYKSKVA